MLHSRIVNIGSPRDSQNRIVLHLKISKWNPAVICAETLLQVAVVLTESLIWKIIYAGEPPISGVNVIFDLQDVTLTHARQITPTFARNYVRFTADCLPFKLLSAHFINTSLTLSILVSLFKRFMNEKSKKRVSLLLFCIYI